MKVSSIGDTFYVNLVFDLRLADDVASLRDFLRWLETHGLRTLGNMQFPQPPQNAATPPKEK